MEITSIKNKHSGNNICPQYLHKKLDMDRTELVLDSPLLIVYESGSFFSHENIIGVEFLNTTTIRIETINKIWTIQ